MRHLGTVYIKQYIQYCGNGSPYRKLLLRDMQLSDLKGYTGKVMDRQPDNGADSADGYDSYGPDGSED